MHKWILIGAGCLLLLVAFLAFQYFRKGTVYVVHGSGYTAITNAEQIVHRANDKQFAKVIQCFIPGDRFDMLWISRQEDIYGGIMLTIDASVRNMRVSFKAASQQVELRAFKKAMSDAHYVLSEESDFFNGGETEEFREIYLDYELSDSSGYVVKAVQSALDHLQPKEKGDYFLSAWLMANGPGMSNGIKFRPAEDPLKEIL